MSQIKNAPRLLGAAFLIVIVTTLIATVPIDLAIGNVNTAGVEPGIVPGIFVKVTDNLDLIHVSILGWLLSSAGIVVLAALCYIVLGRQNRVMALAALGLWLGEAIFSAIIPIGLLGLIPLSRDFVNAGATANPFYQMLGEFLLSGIYYQGFTILMWFYCTGGLLWYYLFYKSSDIPRAISLLGLLAVILGLAGIVLQLFGYNVFNVGFLLILPFEIAIGAWLMLKGTRIDRIPGNTPVDGA